MHLIQKEYALITRHQTCDQTGSLGCILTKHKALSSLQFQGPCDSFGISTPLTREPNCQVRYVKLTAATPISHVEAHGKSTGLHAKGREYPTLRLVPLVTAVRSQALRSKSEIPAAERRHAAL